MASNCNLPSLTLPNPTDILSAIIAILAGLGISIPSLPTIPMPGLFCPLD
jgi:hypothetical protein